ncbi:hypothetical protein HPB48_000479 [Haemaphysalis longicornis]|uniref:Monocarboxylate transporter n=1 Tax=Haemaphysalis longicornis TaxID=44386 RepID=A0A9J6GLR5_HAELO|nr:hypothetical protein HPB48_000479 [Haemaphysalis longicornis]
MGIVETVVAVAIGTCFQKCRSIAMGLKEGGHTISGLIFPKILSSLTAEYGLRGALGVCGALCLHVTAFMLTLRREPFTSRRQRHFKEADKVQLGPPKEDVRTPITDIVSSSSKQSISSSENITMRRVLNGSVVFTNVSNASGEKVQAATSNQPRSKQQSRDTVAGTGGGLFQRNRSLDDYKGGIGKDQRKILLSPGFYTKILMFAIAQYGVVAIKAVVVDYGLDKGTDRSKAELMVTYSAASDFIGRIAIMAFADHGRMSRMLVTVVALLLHSVTTLVLPLTSGFEAYLGVYLLSSMMQSSLSPLVTVIVADYHGAHRIPLVWGLSGLMAIPLQFATPSITGKGER